MVTFGPALAAALAVVVAFFGCTNAPFDPDSLPNQPPTARIFIGAPEGIELNPTSYYSRTFSWSGSDVDGFVEEFYVSVEMESGVSAPWATTTGSDTTMTFTTDDEGLAQALIRVACRDDRGAVSDTVSQYIPLRNFPPVINFVADYDTLFWSYSSANFRFFAMDLDGNVTMDDSVVYYLDTADTLLSPVDEDDPEADPAVRPVRKLIASQNEGLFDVEFHGDAPAGARTLFVKVGDEADAVTTFTWEWDVLPVLSPVLLVDDFGGSYDTASYYAAMDTIFGLGQWSLYNLESGSTDRRWVFAETLRQFECVFWYTGSSPSATLAQTASHVLDYLQPVDPEQTPGKLLLASKSLIGGGGLVPPGFIQTGLGVNTTPSPPSFFIPISKTVRKYDHEAWTWDDPDNPWDIVALRPTASVGGSVGLLPMAWGEPVYRLEYHRYNPRPPYEPLVGIRTPVRAESAVASAVTLTLQLEYMRMDDVVRELRYLLGEELGVELP